MEKASDVPMSSSLCVKTVCCMCERTGMDRGWARGRGEADDGLQKMGQWIFNIGPEWSEVRTVH
jgi:hypothetical protein